MKLYTFKKTYKEIKKGAEIVLSDGYMNEWKNEIENGVIEVHDIDELHPLYNNHDLDGKSILLFRFGGFGDILFATPLIRYLRSHYPGAKIHFACAPRYQMIWKQNKDISRLGIRNYPITWQLLKAYDYHLHFDGIIEGSKDAEKFNAYDLFLRKAGIDYGSVDAMDKIPIYTPDPYAVNKVKNFLAYDLGLNPYKDQIIVIQAKASSAVRTYEPSVHFETAFKLAKDGWKILMVGGPMDIPVQFNIPGIYNIAGQLKMTDSVALLNFCKLVISPDSAFVHFAAAMGVPCVSIFGPFPADLRTRYYPLNISIEPPEDDKEKCWPCFDHSKKCPKADERTFISPCLSRERIPANLIYESVYYLLERIQKVESENTTCIDHHTNERPDRVYETVSA